MEEEPLSEGIPALTCFPHTLGAPLHSVLLGLVNVWDWVAKKRLTQLPPYATSVSALAFSADGSQLAIAASYSYETGEQDHPADAIFVRPVTDSDVRPKAYLK
jgi:hypothetical protein